MINKKILMILSVLVILSIGMINAKMLVAGKLYNSDYSDTVANTNVTVWCGSDYLDTISLADGTYAVVFDVNSCSSVTINTTAPNYMKVVMFIPNDPPADDDDSSGSSGSGGSGGGRFYLCGNGICDSGESMQTCPEDCSVVKDDETDFEELVQKLEISKNDQSNVFSKITGAVIGVFGKTGSAFIIFIIGFMVIAIGVVAFKKRKKISE